MSNLTLTIPFSQQDIQHAFESWGCNCGPAALAAVLQVSLDDVRSAVQSVGFDQKRYTSPSMMERAVFTAGGKITRRNLVTDQRRFPLRGLARIQWTGPWTAPGSNPKWAYRHTHWVASRRAGDQTAIFDINGGIMLLSDWEADIVPEILKQCVPRNDGGWYVTHSWEVARA